MDYRISEEEELFVVFPVSFLVSLDFLDPVVRVMPFLETRAQDIPVLAVKELAVTEDGDVVFGQDDVRRARESFVVFSIAVASAPKGFSKL